MRSWSPKLESLRLIQDVRRILRNTRLGSSSVRFIFYRLVAEGYPKTERDYKNLAELLVKARRAQMIPFDAIVDSGTQTAGGVRGYRSRKAFLDDYRNIADYFTLNEDLDQPVHVELWSEDAGSVPLLADIVADYPVTVYSTGGFSSVTVTHEVAERVARRERPTVFLHVGDYDPSGESIYQSQCQDIGAFVAGKLGGDWYPATGRTDLSPDDDGPDFRPVRVTLTEQQAIDWSLETAPPKASDSRSPNWSARQSGMIDGTVQVQAMTEDQMETVVLEAISEHLDLDALRRVRDRSRVLRDEMAPVVEDAFDNIIKQLGEESE